MRKAQFIFCNENDLLENDSSLTLGYFIIDKVILFEKTKCILVMSLNDLMDGLIDLSKAKGKKSFKWFPADSGEKVILNKENDKLFFQYDNIILNMNFRDFYFLIHKMSKDLSETLIEYRPNIIEETPMIDMLSIMEEFDIKLN